MPRESRVWAWIQNNTKPWLRFDRVEAVYPLGMADCFWRDMHANQHGWLELKRCDANDPAFRAGRIPKIRKEQPMFLRRQAENGVPAGLLLVVDRGVRLDFLVWRASGDHEWVTMMNSERAIVNATASWVGGPEVSWVLAVLIGTQPVPTGVVE